MLRKMERMPHLARVIGSITISHKPPAPELARLNKRILVGFNALVISFGDLWKSDINGKN